MAEVDSRSWQAVALLAELGRYIDVVRSRCDRGSCREHALLYGRQAVGYEEWYCPLLVRSLLSRHTQCLLFYD